MGLAGVLISLALLVWLAFRGWSVLLLAPAAALWTAAFAGEPLLAHWTQTFMGSAALFLAQFFPLFLLGALFGKLMEDSGSVTATAYALRSGGDPPRQAGPDGAIHPAGRAAACRSRWHQSPDVLCRAAEHGYGLPGRTALGRDIARGCRRRLVGSVGACGSDTEPEHLLGALPYRPSATVSNVLQG